MVPYMQVRNARKLEQEEGRSQSDKASRCAE